MKQILLVGVIVCSSTFSAFAACPASKANYQSLEDKTFTITFSEQKKPKSWSNVQATLHTPKRKLDFEFTASNGYEVQSMVLLTTGLKQDHDIDIKFLDKNLKLLSLPQSSDAAPAYIFAPNLGLWVWYSGLEPQEFVPAGIWKFDSCRK